MANDGGSLHGHTSRAASRTNALAEQYLIAVDEVDVGALAV